MLEFLITCLIAAAVIYVFFLVVRLIPLPDAIRQIVLIILGLLAVVWFLDFSGVYHFNLHRPILK